LGRFRFKIGEWEVEYEGENSDAKFDSLVEWAKSKKASVESGAEGIYAPKPKDENGPQGLGRLGLIEFKGSDARFPPNAVANLDTGEAIGLLLYEAGRPLKKAEIDSFVNRGYKQVRPDVTQYFLQKKKYKLARMVIREDDGYKLTGEGELWVTSKIVPKLNAPDAQ
jgi:hypothetical protein